MFLSKITVTDFKNIRLAELSFSGKLNCISGNNGVGKTNLLDAVYSLSMTKSFFNYQDSFSIRHGAEAAALNGTYVMDDGSLTTIGLAIYGKGPQEGKLLKREGRTYKRLSDHIGLFPIVMVSPSDTSLINLSGRERRRFMDALLSQVDREYLFKLQRYNKLIAQRNGLLKNSEDNEELTEAIDVQLTSLASYIYDKRKNLAELLNQSVGEYYAKVSGRAESVAVRYTSDLEKMPLDEVLKKNRERDRMMGFTTSGIHRDDLDFEITSADGEFHPLKSCASQGQQKCFLIALKLSQFAIMKRLFGGTAPILLLDDIFDKLDMSRVEYLLQLVVGEDFSQIFITDSNKVRMEKLVKKIGGECKSFEVEQGNIKEV